MCCRTIENIHLSAHKVLRETADAATSVGDIAKEAELPRSSPPYYSNTVNELSRAVALGLLEVSKHDALCFAMFDAPRV
ncbi:TetR/AcrR family transcriptional regulator, partial [Pseudomonas aeruginosa]